MEMPAAVAQPVDAIGSKPIVLRDVWVRIPPAACRRPPEDHARVRDLAAEGLNISQIARAVGISRPTVRAWLRPELERHTCPSCGHAPHDFEQLPEREYAYLLGIYLGDGTISYAKKRCYRLRVFMDSRYPSIIGEVAAAMRAVMPTSLATIQPKPPHNVVEISSYSNAWPCIFPQHGPGRKHERKIELSPWQEAIVEREPEQFIRGLIHSDGCRTTNRVTVAGKKYAYPRYFFAEVSKDIQELFCRSCRQLGIEYTFSGGRGREISIARAATVARLDAFVGPKS
jgi:Homeodomain-like domain